MIRDSVSRRLVGVLIVVLFLSGGLLLMLLGGPSQIGIAAPSAAQTESSVERPLLFSTSELTHHVYLPLTVRGYAVPFSRMGFCATSHPITRFPEVARLQAGWYVNFGARSNSVRPLGMEYVQTVRLHQLTTCLRDHGQYLRDRDACPYVEPHAYVLNSPKTEADIVSIAQEMPGSLWLIGNEMDRYDWGGENPYNDDLYGDPETSHQDEMLPGVYAYAYHDLYYLIKGADPTAQVAIGGIVQATPARLEYVTNVWEAYKATYGTDMPVDVWNVHNFIFKEKCDDFGADIPPGCSEDVCEMKYPEGVICYGKTYADSRHDDMTIFARQIRDFRGWMKDHDQQNKPLIVSEYGIVYYHEGLEDPDRVREFMLNTFDYFLNTKDPELGYPADDYRLVQRWAWYSLDDPDLNKNQHARLFNPNTLQMTSLGEAFAEYARNHVGD